MEVFLRNLPSHLNDAGLTSHLEPFMNSLGIKYYICEKPKNKITGHIVFLHAADGQRFLARHGEVLENENIRPAPGKPQAMSPGLNGAPPNRAQRAAYPPTRPRLKLSNRHVFCKLSDRKPDQFALRIIRPTVDDRHNKAKPKDAAPDHSPVSVEIAGIHCGYYDYVAGQPIFVSEWFAGWRGHAKFTKRNLIVHLEGRVQIRIPIKTIHELVWSRSKTMTIFLYQVPVFLLANEAETLSSRLASLGVSNNSRRHGPVYERVPALQDTHSKVAGRCLVYRFHVGTTEAILAQKMKEIHDNPSDLDPRLSDIQTRYGDPTVAPSYEDDVRILGAKLARCLMRGTLPFHLLFLSQALVDNAYLPPRTVTDLVSKLEEDFLEARSNGTREPVSLDAFKSLLDNLPYCDASVEDPGCLEVASIMERLHEMNDPCQTSLTAPSSSANLHPNRTRVFRAFVTPSRITLHGPDLEASNRVLRKFPPHQDSFIRVQFGDEDGQDLFYNSKVSLDRIYARFKNVFMKGIPIAGRIYMFLGFSHSSLRSHTAWFCAPFFYENRLRSVLNIINELGDFDKIASPARRAARIGQAFSETPYAIPLKGNGIEALPIPDITTPNGGRVFSDGVGTISPEAAEVIWDYLPAQKNSPNCFQIRWGGAKGMLSLDPSLTGRRFCYRPSMDKFPSEDKDNLEICDMASRPIAMFLNRSLIKIMEDMKVPESWFLRLQDIELRRLRGITASPNNTAKFLKAQNVGDSFKLHILYRQAGYMEIDYRKDPFLRGVVEGLVLRELRLLKHKARIPVQQGITLFGVMDETGYLQEGEIYVSYDSMAGRFPRGPLEGPLLVTRSPALHPGDVQLAYNVVPPDGHPLWSLDNCIVFSQRGNRDLPSQLSGGDLDGDLYNVIWDPEVVHAQNLQVHGAADYPRIKPLELGRPVQAQDIADFFVDFMKTDHLGIIATRHTILADQNEQGTLAPDCIKLAQLHSNAVDFSKTGRAVELIELPKYNHWRPDFLAPGPETKIHNQSEFILEQEEADDNNDDDDEGPRHKYYRSEKILGKLYRGVDEQQIWEADIKRTVPMGARSFWDDFVIIVQRRCDTVSRRHIDWLQRKEIAERIRRDYENILSGLSWQFTDNPHRALTELEVLFGFIVNKSGYQTHKQRDRSIKLRDTFDELTAEIVRAMREPPGTDPGEAHGTPLERCLACLYVGLVPDFRLDYGSSGRRTSKFESFKIVAAATLLRELHAMEAAVGIGVKGPTGLGQSRRGGRH